MSIIKRSYPAVRHGIRRSFLKLLIWRRNNVPDGVFAVTLAVIVGAITGFCAFLLKTFVKYISGFLTSGLHMSGINWYLLLIPVAGILLTGIYVRYILRDNIEHGVAQLMRDLSKKMYDLKSHLTYAPVLASSITLGFGGSAGAEGPIAYTGAAIGSNIGRMFGMSPRLLMIMIGCGAGAGIAGIFKAPIGGVLFTLEVLKMEFTTLPVIALIVSSVVSAMIVYVCTGCTFDVGYIPSVAFDPSIIPYVILLGLFCGVYSIYYSGIMHRMERFYDRISNPWLKNLSSGLLLAVLIFVFPVLYGEGYGSVAQILNGDASVMADHSFYFGYGNSDMWLLIIAAGILIVKAFATSSSNCGGGVAGDFAPTLFAGCIAGYLFAGTLNHFFGLDLPTGNFALIGMAGVMAGAIQAPLMALFITVEMTGASGLFLPVMLCSAISYATVKLITPHSFYAVRLHWHDEIMTSQHHEE